MAKKEYRFAKKEKLRDHPFAKYIRKEVPKKVMVNVERVKPKTKTYRVNVKAVKPETETKTKKYYAKIEKVKGQKTKKHYAKIEKVKGHWANKKAKQKTR